MERERAEEIWTRLQDHFEIDREDFAVLEVSAQRRDAFSTLVSTVLSQNSNDVNTLKAFRRLKEEVDVTPEGLVSADLAVIREAIKIGGLYRVKSKALKALAREVIERYDGNLDKLLEKPLEQAREELLTLPHVGPKTADVLLLFQSQKATFPIDTHIDRVAKRLSFADEDARYDDLQEEIVSFYPSEAFLALHLSLIQFGREVCKARKPLCPECPIHDLCPWPNKTEPEDL